MESFSLTKMELFSIQSRMNSINLRTYFKTLQNSSLFCAYVLLHVLMLVVFFL